jgi:hypothetical protein
MAVGMAQCGGDLASYLQGLLYGELLLANEPVTKRLALDAASSGRRTLTATWR